MKKNIHFLKTTLAASAFALFMSPAQAAIDLLANNTLHNTGAANAYSYLNAPSFGGYVSNTTNTNTGTSHFGSPTYAVTTTSNVHSDPTGSTGAADWISPFANGNSSTTDSYYSYRTSFDLTGFSLSSVNIQGGWASDNKGRAIFVNGVEISTYITPFGVTGVDGFTDKNKGLGFLSFFQILGTSTALNAGLNTIDFVYRNGTDDPSTGLYVEFSSASAIPEPEILVLIGLGALALRVTATRKA